MIDINEFRRARMLAAEQEVVAAIPETLKAKLATPGLSPFQVLADKVVGATKALEMVPEYLHMAHSICTTNIRALEAVKSTVIDPESVEILNDAIALNKAALKEINQAVEA